MEQHIGNLGTAIELVAKAFLFIEESTAKIFRLTLPKRKPAP